MAANKLLHEGKITRTAKGQLPKNYIGGKDKMQRSPTTVGVKAESQRTRSPSPKKKGRRK